MSLEVIYDDSIDSIVIISKKVVGKNDILLLRDSILNHPNFRKNINQLFDSTEGQIDLTSEDLVNIATYYQTKSNQLGNNRKLALVVSRDVDFGRMRQYEAFFDAGPGVIVHSFRSINEAKDWIKN